MWKPAASQSITPQLRAFQIFRVPASAAPGNFTEGWQKASSGNVSGRIACPCGYWQKKVGVERRSTSCLDVCDARPRPRFIGEHPLAINRLRSAGKSSTSSSCEQCLVFPLAAAAASCYRLFGWHAVVQSFHFRSSPSRRVTQPQLRMQRFTATASMVCGASCQADAVNLTWCWPQIVSDDGYTHGVTSRIKHWRG